MKRTYSYTAKPFIKWVGGKTQLLHEIESQIPHEFLSRKHITYVEPFVGGGAMLFHLLNKYPNIQRAVINDINPRLSITYQVVQSHPQELIQELRRLQDRYIPLPHEDRTDMFLEQRARFNEGQLTDIQVAALLIFLNRTCFNGLYRENSKGKFNVPHGKYVNPLICDEQTILADSCVLQRVKILCGDYSATFDYAGRDTFFYFDPPYKPLSKTSSFNSYVKEAFDDEEQIRLSNFCNSVSERGSSFVLSNSDTASQNHKDDFFGTLYRDFVINRVYANRMVNANPDKRGKISELLISNTTPSPY